MSSVIKAKREGSILFADWRRVKLGSVLLLGVTCMSFVAFGAEQQIEEVHTHVEKPSEQVVGFSMTGQPLKKVDLQYHVRYDDLDLTSKDGVKALRKRISIAAREGCADLGRRYGKLGNNLSCSAAAMRSANAQVDQAIARARSLAAAENVNLQADQAIAQTDSSK